MTGRGEAGPRLDGIAPGNGAEGGAGKGAAVAAFAWPGWSGAIPGRATPRIVFWLGGISGCVPAPGGTRCAAPKVCPDGGTGGGGGVGYFAAAEAGAGTDG